MVSYAGEAQTVQVQNVASARWRAGESLSRPIDTVNQVLNTYCANARPTKALAFPLYKLFYRAMHVVHLSVRLSVTLVD